MATKIKTPEELRSYRWYGAKNIKGFAHRQRFQQMGFRRQDFVGKPVIAIVNTWSEMSTCHFHMRQRAEEVRRGILRAGGFPVELPAMSLGEVMVKPTTMLYRNFLAMEVEELLRSHPIDGAILMGGCDKTTPGLMMGALSANLPCIFIPAGPMLSGRWRGKKVGVGTDTKKFWDAYRAGEIADQDWESLEAAMTRSNGTCNTMGTASTMTSIVDAMGFTLPGASSIPAVDSAHPRMATDAGERIVEMVWEDLKPSQIATEDGFHNALVAYAALGGSTNASIHVLAMAGRAGVDLTWEQMDATARRVPVLTNLMPSGQHLMEDFYYAGGLSALLANVADHLRLDALTIAGKTVGETLQGAEVFDDDVLRSQSNPLNDRPAVARLSGNICPDGAVIKASAATPELLQHTGPAVVFDGYKDLAERIDSPDLNITENSVLVMRNGGSLGAPGMPEWGDQLLPQHLLKRGVRDILRISDARMSGTRDGTIVLHASPESALGGGLALVQDGDLIELDFRNRNLNVLLKDEELAARQKALANTPRQPRFSRGYGVIFENHVLPANQGADFDFLAGDENMQDPEIT